MEQIYIEDVICDVDRIGYACTPFKIVSECSFLNNQHMLKLGYVDMPLIRINESGKYIGNYKYEYEVRFQTGDCTFYTTKDKILGLAKVWNKKDLT